MNPDHFTSYRTASTVCIADAGTFFTKSGTSPPTLEPALDYCHQGVRVVPLEPRTRRPWPPYCRKGYKQRPKPDEAEIRSWYDREPNLNIGIHMGEGLIALDVDEHDGKMSGSEALQALEAIYGPLPPTLTSITGTGGRHLLFRLPPGYSFGDSLPVIKAWLLDTTGKATGGVIDFRGSGLIAVPPSIHPNGNSYRWLDPQAEIATLPLAWCQTPLEDPERPARRRKSASHLAPKDLDRRDAIAHEGMANVDADALLGKDTLLRLEEVLEDGADRSHHMYQIILGAASVRFDMDRLYDLMVNSPHEAALREHGGREWFEQRVFEAHQYLAENILAVEEIRAADEECEWTSTGIEPGRNVSSESMKQVFHEVLDIAVRQASLEPVCDKHKIAKAIPCSRMTVVRAFKGLAMLGRLGEVPEPEKPFDYPFKYRLLPPESWLAGTATGLVTAASASGHDLGHSSPGSKPESHAPSVLQTPPSLLPVSGGNQEEVERKGARDLLGESREVLPPTTEEHAAEILRNFDEAPEPAQTKKRTDPWATHTCRQCGQPTLSMRDTDTNRVFRVDAQPSPIGNWVVVDDRWKVLQCEGRTNHEREHDDTEREYYAWHNCLTRDPGEDNRSIRHIARKRPQESL